MRRAGAQRTPGSPRVEVRAFYSAKELATLAGVTPKVMRATLRRLGAPTISTRSKRGQKVLVGLSAVAEALPELPERMQA